jgi:hypothetical protein
MERGKLTEISPFGTGFIEFRDGRVLGFHHSMLQPAQARVQWPLLEGKLVAFEIVNGIACRVRLATDTQAHTAVAR